MLKLIPFWCSTGPTLIRCCVAVLMLIRPSVREVLTGLGRREESLWDTCLLALVSSFSLLSPALHLTLFLFFFTSGISTFLTSPPCFSHFHSPPFLSDYIAANLFPNPPHINPAFSAKSYINYMKRGLVNVCFLWFLSLSLLFDTVL